MGLEQTLLSHREGNSSNHATGTKISSPFTSEKLFQNCSKDHLCSLPPVMSIFFYQDVLLLRSGYHDYCDVKVMTKVFFFENHSYYQNNYFLEGEWGGKWKCLGWLYFFCSKKSSVRPVWSKSADITLTFIFLWLQEMSYIFYVNYMNEFGIWIGMQRDEVFMWISGFFSWLRYLKCFPFLCLSLKS